MKFSYKLKRVCGNVYENGNLAFTPDGNSVLSPVGNRITVFDLVNHSTNTLPFENRKNVKCVAISNNGQFLISVDVEGHALLVNLPRKIILVRFHFKKKVYSIKFSPDDRFFATTHGNGAQIWKTPGAVREFSPLTLLRSLSGHFDETTCLDWSDDSNSLVMGSKDLSVRVFSHLSHARPALALLSGHRDVLKGVFFSPYSPTNTLSLTESEASSSDVKEEECYTIARDGGVFTWRLVPPSPEEKERLEAEREDQRQVKQKAATKKQKKMKAKLSLNQASNSNQEEDGADGEKGEGEEEESDWENEEGKGGSGGAKRVRAGVRGAVRGGREGVWTLVSRDFLWEEHANDVDRPEGDGKAKTQTQKGKKGQSSGPTRSFASDVSSVSFNKASKLMVVGFKRGVFALYEMPGLIHLHRLSLSSSSINSVSINPSGEWLAIGSSNFGQLLVWEWRSESYVLKQQGHLYGMKTVDYSADGLYLATGGEDGKVKLWNALTGFCFITFSEHLAPVTAVKFVTSGGGSGGAGLGGRAILSCSLDGTVRAHDLLRYRNFRTLTTPTPAQLTCLASDPSGEVVCAGSLDPFNIYVWSLQTGQLLDVLSGHEGPIACLAFSPALSTSTATNPTSSSASGTSGTILASGSWDGTLKLWDVFQSRCSDTHEHGCDVLGLAFRPDGKEIATVTTNGNITMWDVEEGAQVGLIEGRRDLAGGRSSSSLVSSQASSLSKHFSCISYSADGEFLLAGGKSKFTCIYARRGGGLIRKYQLSHNRSLDGLQDQLRSDLLVDGVAVGASGRGPSTGKIGDSDDEDDEGRTFSNIPGASGRSSDPGRRSSRPELLTSAVRFSPTGREWAAATTQGLQIFSLDGFGFGSGSSEGEWGWVDLDEDVSPQAVVSALSSPTPSQALSLALRLGEKKYTQLALYSLSSPTLASSLLSPTPSSPPSSSVDSDAFKLKDKDDSISFFLSSPSLHPTPSPKPVSLPPLSSSSIHSLLLTLSPSLLRPLLKFLSEELLISPHSECLLRWGWETLLIFGGHLQSSPSSPLDSLAQSEALRSLLLSLSSQEKDVLRMTESNKFSLSLLLEQHSAALLSPSLSLSSLPSTQPSLTITN